MSVELRFTNREKFAALVRELRMRRDVYPRQVRKGNMTAHNMEYEIAIMEELVEQYRELADQETGQQPLPLGEGHEGRVHRDRT